MNHFVGCKTEKVVCEKSDLHPKDCSANFYFQKFTILGPLAFLPVSNSLVYARYRLVYFVSWNIFYKIFTKRH